MYLPENINPVSLCWKEPSTDCFMNNYTCEWNDFYRAS